MAKTNKTKINKKEKNTCLNRKGVQKKLLNEKCRQIKKLKFKQRKNESKEITHLHKNKQSIGESHFISFRKQLLLEQIKKQQNEFNFLLKELKKQNLENKNEKKCIFALRNNVDCTFYKSKKILQKLKLEKPFTGVIMINTEKNLKNLFLVKPFVCYGYINRSNFINLMSTLLQLKFNKHVARVKGNEFIEKKFNNYNFHCFEDLCNYIYNCEKDAELIISKYFLPFNFTYLKKDINFDFLQIEPELVGNLEDKMNNVLKKIC